MKRKFLSVLCLAAFSMLMWAATPASKAKTNDDVILHAWELEF